MTSESEPREVVVTEIDTAREVNPVTFYSEEIPVDKDFRPVVTHTFINDEVQQPEPEQPSEPVHPSLERRKAPFEERELARRKEESVPPNDAAQGDESVPVNDVSDPSVASGNERSSSGPTPSIIRKEKDNPPNVKTDTQT